MAVRYEFCCSRCGVFELALPMGAAPAAPLAGYQVAELEVTAGSAADGARLDHVAWPEGSVPVSVLRRRYRDASPGLTMRPGDRISLLVPATGTTEPAEDGREKAGQPRPVPERTRAGARPAP